LRAVRFAQKKSRPRAALHSNVMIAGQPAISADSDLRRYATKPECQLGSCCIPLWRHQGDFAGDAMDVRICHRRKLQPPHRASTGNHGHSHVRSRSWRSYCGHYRPQRELRRHEDWPIRRDRSHAVRPGRPDGDHRRSLAEVRPRRHGAEGQRQVRPKDHRGEDRRRLDPEEDHRHRGPEEDQRA
jgi:hypothetical protein